MTLQQWFILLFCWVDDTAGVTSAARHADVSENSVIAVFQWFREVASQRIQNDPPPRLGGPGVVVEIDESCFTHKRKVSQSFEEQFHHPIT